MNLNFLLFPRAGEKFLLAGGKIIPADDGLAAGEQTVHEIAADETGGAGDKNLFHSGTRSLVRTRRSCQRFRRRRRWESASLNPANPPCMLAKMKAALAQINTTVGDLQGNEAKILAAYARASAAGADLVVAPELALTGYPPRDLVLNHDFVAGNLASLQRLAQATGRTALVTGFVGRNERRPGRSATNAIALLQNGKIAATRTKTLLPTYDVFDEDRYFEPATENAPVILNGTQIGLTICEDVWNDEDFWDDRLYRRNPAAELVKAGAKLIVNASASPWHLGKNKVRRDMLANLAAKSKCPVIYCNLAGGNDELIFDGASLAFNGMGQLLAEGKMFSEDFILVDLENAPPKPPADFADEEMVYRALVLGVRDYLHKCGFKSAVLGLSGGIDSALTAVIAAAALGPRKCARRFVAVAIFVAGQLG